MSCGCGSPSKGLGDTLARAIICHGCIHRTDRTCGLSGVYTDLHIDGKPCPADLYPDDKGQCNFLGTKTQGVPKILRWWARLTAGRFDGRLNDCGCFVALLNARAWVSRLFRGVTA